MARRYCWAIAASLALTMILISSPVLAVPGLINYQGKLTDAGGNPLNGTFTMTFHLFDAASGGASLWDETQSVEVIDGIYSVQLGAVNSFSEDSFSNDDLYLEVEVEGETLSPRQRLTSTAFAMKAAVAENMPDGAVTTIHIVDGAVTAEKVCEDAITTEKLADGAVMATNMADGTALSEILDDDGSDSGLDADKLDGKEASDFALSAHNHDSAYVNRTGDSMSGSLGFAVLIVENSSSTGRAIYGKATDSGDVTNYGGYFTANGKYGTGVSGSASGDSGTGVSGGATGDSGTGVSGGASGDFGIAVEGIAGGRRGMGVKGLAYSSESGSNYGGHFSAWGSSGVGVWGEAKGNGGKGVYAYATGSSGIGVYSRATGSSGGAIRGEATDSGDVWNYGGSFSAAGSSGRGVAGAASNSGDVTNYGGSFSAAGSSGRGVAGNAWNQGDVENYGGHFTARGGLGRGVYGLADNTGDVENYGGYFEAAGNKGYGVYGYAISAGDVANYGGYFEANGLTGYGVYGYAARTNVINKDVVNYGGYFEAAGNKGYGVYGKSRYIGGFFACAYEQFGNLDLVLGGQAGKVSSDPDNTTSDLILSSNNDVEIRLDNDGDGGGVFRITDSQSDSVITVDEQGKTAVKVLEITGGSDLSERFDIHGGKAGLSPSPGMLVSIDPEKPGNLMVSNMAYDQKVAGIISGAGGIKPGMLMGQKGSKADGANPVALTGRAYCLADASNGPIEPGDLLTTSTSPGHAMKVTDFTRAQGAVIGKAMSPLDKGQGLVLVLITLQ